MSNQSYQKKCMYCDQEILMDINGNSNWAAFNLNGGYHQCKKQEPIVAINQEPANEAKTLSKRDLEKLKKDINKAFDTIMSEAFK